MPHDWLRLGPEIVRLNLQKARHARQLGAAPARARPFPAPCQSPSDSGRARDTHCEACMRFDSARRYRLVCAHLELTSRGAFCRLDSAQIRPEWRRVLVFWTAPWVVLALLALLGTWSVLRFGTGLAGLSPLDVAFPSRWSRVSELKRQKFTTLALSAIHRGDFPQAGVALFTAARIGRGAANENLALARIATLGGYHSLADELHAQTIAAHPDRTDELTLAWHDDLLVANRKLELARLSLAQLARPGSPREFWLRSFFESLRHPGVAATLHAENLAASLPHPGLRHALLARRAIDSRDRISAHDELIALSGLPPGDAARSFLTHAWLDLGETARAHAAALSTRHPSEPGEISLLAHEILRAEGNIPQARAVLRRLLEEPTLRPRVLGALVRHADPELLREFFATLPEAARSDPRLLAGLWIAARRAGLADLATTTETALANQGGPIPAELRGSYTQPLPRESLRLAAALVMPDREVLIALYAAR